MHSNISNNAASCPTRTLSDVLLIDIDFQIAIGKFPTAFDG